VRGSPADILEALREEATAIRDEGPRDVRAHRHARVAAHTDGARVLTHCNAARLRPRVSARALAPIYLAASAGRRVEVLVDETRPLLQGSRLTSWELTRAGIPATVIADNMAASLMRLAESISASSEPIASRATATSRTKSARTALRSRASSWHSHVRGCADVDVRSRDA
jgi:methylthioribose-1-phosphate isomerase